MAFGMLGYADSIGLDIKKRLALFLQACEAVQFGHQQSVVHRDLKPSNILVDGRGRVKIIDFGIARTTDADLQATTALTNAHELIGTLQYMSPEQCAADARRIDTRADVYALGVVLFQLLTGKLPYNVANTTLHTAIRMVCEQPPAQPSTFDSHLRGDLDAIILKAIAKSPEARYQSASQLADDVRRH